jgi:hypothetical protein
MKHIDKDNESICTKCMKEDVYTRIGAIIQKNSCICKAYSCDIPCKTSCTFFRQQIFYGAYAFVIYTGEYPRMNKAKEYTEYTQRITSFMHVLVNI